MDVCYKARLVCVSGRPHTRRVLEQQSGEWGFEKQRGPAGCCSKCSHSFSIRTVAPNALTLSASGQSGIRSCSFLGPQRREEAGGSQEPWLCCPLLSSSADGGVRPSERRRVGQIWVILCADQLGGFGDRPARKGDATRCLRPLPSGFRKCLCRQE